MSRGRHSKPHPKGGGLATFLALAVAGGAVALAGNQPTSRVLRYCVVGLAALSSFQLLMMARTQRISSRAMARTEDRLRTLEQRNREEGDELHRRVLAGVTREGELRRSVEILVEEISRLRASLEAFVPLAAPVAAEPAGPVTGDGYTTVDIPLIQRVLAAQQQVAVEPEPSAGVPTAVPAAVPAAMPAADVVPEPFRLVAPAAPVEDTPWPTPIRAASPAPAAGELWRAPSRPEYVPAPPAADGPGTSWVVREIQLEGEPGAALTMRILDLTTPAAPDAVDGAAAEDEAMGSWTHFARPA